MVKTNVREEVELEFAYLADGLPNKFKGSNPKRLIDVYNPETDVIHTMLRIRNSAGKLEITNKYPVTKGDASAQYEITVPLQPGGVRKSQHGK